MVALLMSFLRVPLFTLISYYLFLYLGFCKAYQNCLVPLIKITTVYQPSPDSQLLTYTYCNVLRVFHVILKQKPTERPSHDIDFFMDTI